MSAYKEHAIKEAILLSLENKPRRISKVLDEVAEKTGFAYINAFTEVVSPMIRRRELKSLTINGEKFVQLGSDEDHNG